MSDCRTCVERAWENHKSRLFNDIGGDNNQAIGERGKRCNITPCYIPGKDCPKRSRASRSSSSSLSGVDKGESRTDADGPNGRGDPGGASEEDAAPASVGEEA